MSQQLRVRVPGKLMLFGEYTVLWHEECLAFSLDCHMTIDAQIDPAGIVSIESDLWDEPLVLSPGRPLPDFAKGHLLITLIPSLLERYPLPGLKLKVRSAWAVADGLGSSSALSLGVSVGIACLARPELTRQKLSIPGELWDCAKLAWQNQVAQQGFASGYDIACQLAGGLLGFAFTQEKWPATINSYTTEGLSEFVHIFAGGRGAPTKKVGGKTLTWINEAGVKDELVSMMNDARLAFVAAIEKRCAESNSLAISKIARLRRLLAKGPCFPLFLEDALQTCPGLDREFTYKTAGAGGEDSIILFGHANQITEAEAKLAALGWKKLAIKFPCGGTIVEDVSGD